MRRPLAEGILAGLSSSLVITLLVLPPTPYLAPVLQPVALTLTGAWLAWCLARLDRALRHYRAWHVTADWQMSPDEVLKKGV